MTLIAALVLQRFTLTPLGTEPPKPRMGVTLRPANGLTLRLAARQPRP